MSQLLTCWKRKPCPECQERAAAPCGSSGTETRLIPLESDKPPKQVVSTNPMQRQLDILQASAPAFLLRVQNDGSRRHDSEARLDQAWLVQDVDLPLTVEHRAIEDAEEAEVRRLDGRRAFFESLLGQINELRRLSSSPGQQQPPMQPLQPSSVLCRVAQNTWHRLAEQPQGLGFACLRDCCVNQIYPDGDPAKGAAIGMVHDCLTYCDVPGHSKRDLPAAALHYWQTGGSFTVENAKQKSSRRPEFSELYPPQDSDARLQLDGGRDMFKNILLDAEASCIGLYFKKAKTGMEHAAWMYCVIAVFA